MGATTIWSWDADGGRRLAGCGYLDVVEAGGVQTEDFLFGISVSSAESTLRRPTPAGTSLRVVPMRLSTIGETDVVDEA
jgi:hypothetical protein